MWQVQLKVYYLSKWLTISLTFAIRKGILMFKKNISNKMGTNVKHAICDGYDSETVC